MTASRVIRWVILLASLGLPPVSPAQEVVLPAPRLLTVFPMGGQVGTSFDLTISGDSLDEGKELLFSNPAVHAEPKLGADGKRLPNQYSVRIENEAERGICEVRVMTRLGVSSSRAFSVGSLPELLVGKPNTSVASALELKLNSVCNAVPTKKAVDYYWFEAKKGMRVVADCAAKGIDSKLNAVLIIADSQERDLLTDRSGGVLDFYAPADGKYFVKVHSLTFQGGPQNFYRLALREVPVGDPLPRQNATASVGSFSWNPEESAGVPKVEEVEASGKQSGPQKLTLPCLIEGGFSQAADVDVYEFAAKKSEVWWIEVVSERLGLSTDPFVVVQRVKKVGLQEELIDVVEFNDIASPIKPSTNTGNGYIGPPYDAGSADVLGKLEIKENGIYRLQLWDLLGGTRGNPANVYKLIIRKAAPDFALVGWAMHMDLRNQDRAVVPKPIALRGGSTMAFEVAVVRKDGFDGEIELGMDGLPNGMTASGLKIPAGKTSGTLLISASEDAPRFYGPVKIFGRAQINNLEVRRPCRLSSVVWPIVDGARETPDTRLLGDVMVSVGGEEKAAISVAPVEDKVWEAKAGGKLTIPLTVTWRGEATGAFKMKVFGGALSGVSELNVPLKASSVEAVFDLAAMKSPPGEYRIAFYGSAVTKHRRNLPAVKIAEEAEKQAEKALGLASAQVKQLSEAASAASPESKAAADGAAKAAIAAEKLAEAAKAEATKRVKAATDFAQPRDIADIVVSEPIRILIKPGDVK